MFQTALETTFRGAIPFWSDMFPKAMMFFCFAASITPARSA
jgi:hypothetical protein